MRDRKNDKKKKDKKHLPSRSNPATKYYDPTDDHGLKTYFPPPDYAAIEREIHLREHAPWQYKPISVSDPTCLRRKADAERRVRDRVGWTRADQLAVQRSVGVASLLNANLHAAPRRPNTHPADWAYAADQDADISLGRDLHRISEELDVDVAAQAAAAVASVAADAAERQKWREARRERRAAEERALERARGFVPKRDSQSPAPRVDRADRAHRDDQDDQNDTMPTNEYQGKSARAIAGKLMMESVRNLCLDRSASALGLDRGGLEQRAALEREAAMSSCCRRVDVEEEQVVNTVTTLAEERNISQSLDTLKRDIRGIQAKSYEFLEGTRCSACNSATCTGKVQGKSSEVFDSRVDRGGWCWWWW